MLHLRNLTFCSAIAKKQMAAIGTLHRQKSRPYGFFRAERYATGTIWPPPRCPSSDDLRRDRQKQLVDQIILEKRSKERRPSLMEQQLDSIGVVQQSRDIAGL